MLNIPIRTTRIDQSEIRTIHKLEIQKELKKIEQIREGKNDIVSRSVDVKLPEHL